jgi:hypothetical protein
MVGAVVGGETVGVVCDWPDELEDGVVVGDVVVGVPEEPVDVEEVVLAWPGRARLT